MHTSPSGLSTRENRRGARAVRNTLEHPQGPPLTHDGDRLTAGLGSRTLAGIARATTAARSIDAVNNPADRRGARCCDP